ncbi:MAG: cobyric acid synthase [Acidobacteria bacterium]|nr:MAG: cobyric acid synthase [Acidobacteriota bacterium]
MVRRARALMVLGTGSHVGKSVVTAALGRIFSDRGYRVAPFKAQNMALNSAATPDGREIGRAQAMQAEACRVAPRVEMNPILIKPASQTGAQVVVLGRVWGDVTALDYHRRRVEDLFPTVLESYEKLAADHEIIVLEGAGSPAEINLREHDIVNMRMAHAAGAACLLLGDIDRGGVFAAIYGTFALVGPEDRARIRAFAINKFRGDLELLRPGLDMMEARVERPCAGVIPYVPDLGIEEEDGVAVEDRRTAARAWGSAARRGDGPGRRLRVGVVALPHLANFTDFDALAAEPEVALAYLERPDQAGDADVLVLPGSKATLDDLDWLERAGFAAAVRERARAAPRRAIVGVCGGMQMLGRSLADPSGVENQGRSRSRPGLGLLPITTVLDREKVTRRAAGRVVAARFVGAPAPALGLCGYEIHMGETVYEAGAAPFAEIRREGEETLRRDGAASRDGFVFGTYLHGLFDDDAFRHAFIRAARAACGLAPPGRLAAVSVERAGRFDRLAEVVRRSLDIDRIEAWLGEPIPIT